jgi:hypothetical protein
MCNRARKLLSGVPPIEAGEDEEDGTKNTFPCENLDAG